MIRLAMLGCGAVARAHAHRLRRHRGEVSLSFASRDGERALRFAHELGGTAGFASYEAALASPSVDAVLVATPPRLHLPLALAALEAGKHVVVEKPPFLRTSDLDAVAAAAARAGRRVLVAENYFYKPSLRRLRSLVAEGVVGEVLFVHVNAIKAQRTGGWRDDPALAGAGALYEGGIHWASFVNNLGLTVSDVRGLAPGGARPMERSMLLALAFAEGAVGTLSYSWEVPSLARGLRLSKIYGRKGTITFESNGLWILAHGTRRRLYLPGVRDLAGYHAMWSDLVRALRDGADAAYTLAHARRDLDLVERAYATAGLSPPGSENS